MAREVELSDDEYEVVQLGPMRKLEKRLDSLEGRSSMGNLEKFIDKILDMVELNQKIVDEVVRANQGLREDLSVLIGKMDVLHDKMSSFIDVVKQAGEEEENEVITKTVIDQGVKPFMEEIVKSNSKATETNKAIIDSLGVLDKRLKRMQLASSGPQLKPRRMPFAAKE